jgi:hypothetical protein
VLHRRADLDTRGKAIEEYPSDFVLEDRNEIRVFSQIIRRAVNCRRQMAFQVAGNRVLSAGGGRVSGTVNHGGSVAVNVSVGASKANGGGRLAGTSGAGSWRGIISGDQCSGTWQATRG